MQAKRRRRGNTINGHVLDGCRPTLLSSYLKALGTFRIVATQLDPHATACWENGRFVLGTDLSREQIMGFLADKYAPTPVIAPWSYNKYQKTVKIINESLGSERFAPYRNVMEGIGRAEKEFSHALKPDKPDKPDKLDNAQIKNEKSLFLRLCRNNLPDEAIPYLDAVFALKDKVEFAPLAGSGMNDGNYDMAENFVKYLQMLLGDKPHPRSKDWLMSALFDEITNLDETTMVGHNPDAAGGPNSGEGFAGKALSNPWEYVLMIEGMVLFAGNMARRQSGSSGRAAFPFTTNASTIGYATASHDEENRGEIWLPVWDNPATYREVAHVFSEGRVQLGGRQAETGTEFARAMISMGTERGITGFHRFCVMKRKGDAYLYINAGRIRTTNKPSAALLNDLDEWYGHVSKQSRAKNATATLTRLTRAFDSSLMKFCRNPKPESLLELLVATGKIERYISGQDDFRPLRQLSSDWLTECYDGSAEYRLAASIASIRSSGKVGSIRENLEGIQKEGSLWKHDKDSKRFVWKENSGLLKNMADTLQRRAMDGKVSSLDHVPIDGTIRARFEDVVRFLNGDVDMKKINDLALPLSIIAPDHQAGYPWSSMGEKRVDLLALPEPYIIMKLVYFPDIGGKIQPAAPNAVIPYDMSVLALLNAKRIDDGYAKASQILHSHGLSPWSHANTKTPGRVSLSKPLQERITAALLFPISPYDGRQMMEIVIKPHDTTAQQNNA